jgi:low affinity Fe/Cu permease
MRLSDQDVAPSVRDRFNTVAARITSTLGSPYVLTVAVALVVLWAVSGPFFQFSEEWQLIINTTTTIITFLMVFVIQASQNRDSKAIHLKLDEVIRALGGARNEMIGAEREGEAELRRREADFLRIAEEATIQALDEHHGSQAPHADSDEAHAAAARRAARSAKVRAAARSAAEGRCGSAR